MELLDSSQNNSFIDHYLDVPFDFSRVLFICTANDDMAIAGPLKDRMDVVRLSGYDIPEKVAIAKHYLVPKVFCEAGLWKRRGQPDRSSVAKGQEGNHSSLAEQVIRLGEKTNGPQKKRALQGTKNPHEVRSLPSSMQISATRL